MHVEHKIEVAAKPEVLFSIYQDVENWHTWDPDTKQASLVGKFEVGSCGQLTPTKGRTVPMRLTEVIPNRRFTVEAKIPLFRMVFEHELLPTNGGTEVIHRAAFSGLLSLVIGPMLIRQLNAGLPTTLTRLKQLAEAKSATPLIRPETAADALVIAEVVRAAFLAHAHSDGSEPKIVERLRSMNDLSVSLVAEQAGRIVGHVAFSPVSLEPSVDGWYGLGPLSVHPSVQRRGVGSQLVREGLSLLRARGARGCVVFGSLAYYARFGFASCSSLRYAGGPPELFHAITFGAAAPNADVRYSPAFDSND